MKLFAATAVLLLSCFLTGCVGNEYHYVDAADVKPGPGLFSGEDGVFTVYGRDSTNRTVKKAGKEKEPQNADSL